MTKAEKIKLNEDIHITMKILWDIKNTDESYFRDHGKCLINRLFEIHQNHQEPKMENWFNAHDID